MPTNSASEPAAGIPLVEFIDVQKTYDGENLAVRDLNLTIRKGEFLTLLGPSGSGKTTSLMMLAGFEVPTAGDILLAGKSLSRVPSFRRNMGVVFQSYALFPHLTVAENLAFPLSVRHVPSSEIRSRIDRALQLVQLGGLGERRPAQLSGGQQQRVALARAMIFDPDVVLMDEPLGSLDKQLREHLQIEIKHIQQSLGLTVVYVTHDQSEALTMSDRIAVFDQGAIQQLATPEELYEQPQNAFVAQFIGESNRLVGTVLELEDHRCIVEVEGGVRVHALPVKVEALGARTTLSIRPERVVVRPTPGSCETVLSARIEELIYHGDHRRVRLRLPNGGDFLIKVPNAEHEKDLGAGELIDIGWRTGDCRALDAP